ncbi:MAG: prepilin-type N-terminal cleavage/methylation domain-containing protein [Rhodocyclaceae bacterium]|nr:MAG: prepilin-type N-terminal cleavage/methylation domain-containing protein [Rhodocyclaceae bacterium]
MKRASPTCRQVTGLTLIELLVALAIFAVLGVMGYRAVAVATTSRERVSAEFQRWQDASRFLQAVENDLTQFVPRADWRGPAVGDALSLVVRPGQLEWSFLKLDGASGSVRRRGYRLDAGHLSQLRWPGTDNLALPTAYLMLDQVTALRCVVVDTANRRHGRWPDAGAIAAAVDLELELDNVGTLRRLIPLR